MERTFGSFLKEKRLEKALTQKELARILFVSESCISKWEKDVSRPDISILPKLSETLGVTEHELICSSVDVEGRREKREARKWRILSRVWDLFFYISYSIALITVFICNIAVEKRLSWFFIVAAALILAFSFTNLPKLIKRHRLVLIPLSMYTSLCILLAVCAIYTGGEWFFIASVSVLLGLTPIFVPIYIAKLDVFSRIRKNNDFFTLGVTFLMTVLLLAIVFIPYVISNPDKEPWFFTIALPITVCVYLVLNVFLSVRLLRTNKFLKTALVLFLAAFFLYLIPPVIRLDNAAFQAELDDANVFLSDFSKWNSGTTIERNVHCIIFLVILLTALAFCIVGLIKKYGIKNGEKSI